MRSIVDVDRISLPVFIETIQNHPLVWEKKVKLITASLADKSITPHEAEEKILHARIDEANKLIKIGKCSTALNLLNQLRIDTDGKNPSKSVLYRLSTNIGYCHHVLDEVQEAKDEFLLAYKLEPNNAKAIANYAAVLLQTGKAEEALTLIKESGKVQKGESVLAANYISVLLSLDKKADYDALLVEQSWILDEADCCFAIGNRMFENGKY
jgi:predicted Zn-dependent protease